jgi:peptidyl-prolyl cis-trans isomerase C
MPFNRLLPRSALALVALTALPLVLATGAVADDAPADPVVATVDGNQIHRSDVAALQHSLPQELQQMPIEQIYPKLVDQLVNRQLMMDAATKAGLGNDPEVKKRLEILKPRVEMDVYVDHIATKAVSDDKLHALYTQSIASAANSEEIHARHILLQSEDDAKAVIAQLDKGADFAKLADQKSTDKGESGGDLGWFTADKMVPEFSAAAFKLKKGQYTETPVHTQFGWHVIQVLDTRPATPPTFDSVKDQLAQQLQGQALDATIDKLRGKAKIVLFNPDGSPLKN